MKRSIRAALAAGLATAAFLLSSSSPYAAAPATPQGAITAKEFLDVVPGDVSIPSLTNHAKFPNNPDITSYPARFEWPTGPDDETTPIADVRNNYGIQVIGYYYPPTTGSYRFALAADDNAVLYLSTDENPANKVLIGTEPGWNPVRAWDANANGRLIVDAGTADERLSNQSKPIQLVAGRAYYIEGLVKEAGGGDNIAVAVRSDGSWPAAGDLPILGAQLSTFDKASGPVSILTQPQSQTILEGLPVTLSVVANGTPPYTFQWKKGGVDIDGATGDKYSIQFTSSTNAGQYTVVVTGSQGPAVTSSAATLTITSDTVAPTLAEVGGTADFLHVSVKFSERVARASAETAANYRVNDGVTVSAAVLQADETTVILTTSRQAEAHTYTLTVSNVRDLALNPNTIVANSTKTFSSAVFKTGLANWQRWQSVDGDAGNIDTFVENLANPDFRGSDAAGVSGYLGSPRGVADNYGVKAFTYFIPPTTGGYVFSLACDDLGYLFLSTDDNPANKVKIAAQPAWSDLNQWDDPDTDQNQSDLYDASEWVPANTINLTAGRRYYMEVAFTEGGGGDGSEVTYWLASGTRPANGTASTMTGAVIGTFVNPDVLPPVITTRPTGVKYNKGDTLTFSVVADSVKAVTYQWFRSKKAIAGATNATLTIPNADHTAVGDYYVDVSNSNGTATSFPDDSVRALMNGAFLIEAEDFNYEGGKTLPVASVMPYLGNAYTNKTTITGIDHGFNADNSGGAAFAYTGRFTVGDPEVVEMKGGLASETADAIQNALNRDRGSFSVTANYAIGWTVGGEWINYTRTFPEGNYAIVGALAHDGRGAGEINQILSLVANPLIPDGGTPPTEGKLQGLTKLGSFVSPATGAWSSNDLIPLTDDAGNIVTVPLSGTKTLRLTFNQTDGDADYFLLYPLGGGGGGNPAISIAKNAAGAAVITFEGTLQSADVVSGPYNDVAGATSPTTVTPAGAAKYYRSKR